MADAMTRPVVRILRRHEDDLSLPDLSILGRRVEPYVLHYDDGDYYDLSVSFQIDEEDTRLGLFFFVRTALHNEIAEASAGIAPETDLPETIRALGLPASLEWSEVAKSHEADLMVYGSDLVLGVRITSTDAGASRAAFDFAILRILPQFLETS
jgi:hypothetical protein